MRFQLSIIIIVFMECAIVTQSTSQYEGISWNEERKRWQVEFDFSGKKSKYYFENKCDATKTRNRAYKKMKITPQDTNIREITNQQKNEKISQYKGVSWYKRTKQWRVQICLKGQNPRHGGMFKDELNAAKRVNQLCEELGISSQNPAISAIPDEQYQKKEKTSLYKGVYWHKERRKWYVSITVKEGKKKYGGVFDNELEAAKRVNQLCQEFGIPLQHPTISGIPNEKYQKKENISQYKGVSWHKQRKRWRSWLYFKGMLKFGGNFKDELDAGKRVNQLCEEIEIPLQNPEISTMPNQQFQEREKFTSQYKGVDWHKQRKIWRVRVWSKEGKSKFGGNFKDELDAAKRVNQFCEELGIPPYNPDVVKIPTQVSPHNDFQSIENPVISSEISNTDNDDANKHKRKREKEFKDDDKRPVEKHYFYDYLLK